jgi:hypothetical protein
MEQQPLATIDPALLVLIHGAFTGAGTLQPFAREIMLIACRVAGTSHRPLSEIEPALQPGAFLPLQRDPDNPHDPLAIRIHNEQGVHLGFVPREKNEVLARLMDAGKLLFGRLVAKEWKGDWLKLEVRIFLRDL